MKRNNVILAVIGIGLILLILFYFASSSAKSSPSATPLASQSQTTTPEPSPSVLGQQTKTTGCVAADALPDKACTPGAAFSGVTRDQVCRPGYAKSVRNVPTAEKNAVYREYGIAQHQPGQYEVDHLISLELGGSNDMSNLWPEPADPRPGFHEKDRVENYLNQQVCSGAMTLQQAQQAIATNWLAIDNTMPK